jgi:hypothetical protein
MEEHLLVLHLTGTHILLLQLKIIIHVRPTLGSEALMLAEGATR